MKKNKWIISIVCLAAGAVLFILNWTQFYFQIGKTNISIYPAAFFTLVGALLVVSDLFNRKIAE